MSAPTRFSVPVTEIFRQRLGLIFCGAGISKDAPASLPSWNSLRDRTLEAVLSLDPALQMYLPHLVSCPCFRSSGGRGLPPELVASKLSQVGTGYFESFRALESGEPNRNHRHLAHLARAGLLKFIVTTNFDLFIEAALQDEAVPYRSYRTTEEFQTFDASKSGVHLLKLHGCISLPASITATVEQEGRGLPPSVRRALRTLLSSHIFVFWGYSGEDLKIDIDYLGMKSCADSAKGFIWSLFDSGDGTAVPNSEIVRLQEIYGDRGKVGHNVLPHATEPLVAGFTSAEHVTPKANPMVDGKDEILRMALLKWASEHLTKTEAAFVCGNLLIEAGCLKDAKECQEHVLSLARSADDKLWQRTANIRLSDIHQEMGDLAGAYSCAQEALRIAESGDEAWMLVLPLERLAAIHILWGHYNEALECLETAMRRGGQADKSAMSRILSERARVCSYQGRSEEALKALEESERLCQSGGDTIGLSTIWVEIGHLYLNWGDLEKAECYYKKAEDIDIAYNRKIGVAFSRQNLASIHIARGEYVEATRCLNEASNLASDAGQQHLLAGISASLGAVALSMERKVDALAHYQRAAEIFKAHGERLKLGQVICNIAAIYNLEGEPSVAVDAYSEALKEFDSVGADFLSGTACRFIGGLLSESLNRPQEALKYFQRSLMHYRRAESTGEVPGVFQELVLCMSRVQGSTIPFAELLAVIALRYPVLADGLKRVAQVIELEVQPLTVSGLCAKVAEIHGNQRVESTIVLSLTVLGQQLREQRETVLATGLLNACCNLAEAVGDLHLASIMANDAGLAFITLGALQEAEAAFEAGEKFSRRIADEYELVTRLNNRALVYLKKGAADRAIEILSEAEQCARRLVGRDQLVRVLTTIAECYKTLGDTPMAIQYYKELESTACTIGDHQKQLQSLMGLGKCYRNDGQLELSVQYRRRAALLAESMKEYDTAGLLSGMIANTYHRDLKEPARARPHYIAAIAYFQKSGNLELTSQFAGRMAECEAAVGESVRKLPAC